MEKSISAVTMGPGKTELREFDLPEIGDEDALLKIEAAGVCGSDWPFYAGIRPGPPRIQGHENVGYIAKIGANASKRWGVKEGDRVAVEEFIPCGTCWICRTGNYRICDASDAVLVRDGNRLRYGSTSIAVEPSIWGGYGQYQYLHPNSIVYKLESHVPAEVATLFIPISNGIRWINQVGGVKIGDTVVIFGPGQHGLGCVIAAKEAGARCVIVVGLTSDQHRFDVARQLGADYTIDSQKEDVVERVKQITNNQMADIVIDITPGATDPVEMAGNLARKMGTVILAGQKFGPVPQFSSSNIHMKELTVRGVRGHDLRSVTPAIAIIESGKYDLKAMCTHTYTLNQVDRALQTIGGKGDANSIHVSVLPII